MLHHRAALLVLVAGLFVLLAGITPLYQKPIAQNEIVERFVEDPPRLVVHAEDPPPPLPDRALARLGPIKDADPTGQLEFSPDGRLLIVGIETGLQIWNVANKTLVRTMPRVYRGRFSPDGKALATLHCEGGGPNGPELSCEFVLFHLASGKEVRHYSVPSGWIHQFNFLENNKLMYVASKGIHTLNLKSGVHTLVCDTGYFDVFSLDFSPKTMTTAYVRHGVVGDGSPPALLHCRSHKTDVLDVKMNNNPAVCLSADGKILATMGGAPLHLFNAETAESLSAPETSSVDKCVFGGQQADCLGRLA